MKIIFIGLISVVAWLAGSSAYADLLGEDDDTYIGFQVSVPLAANRSPLMSARFEYSALLINQQDGIRDGIVFTRNTDGKQTLGYVTPSRTYRIDRSQASDYTIPIVWRNENSEIRSTFSAVGAAASIAIVVVAISKLTEKVLDETTDCLDPDVASEHIAGC